MDPDHVPQADGGNASGVAHGPAYVAPSSVRLPAVAPSDVLRGYLLYVGNGERQSLLRSKGGFGFGAAS